MEHPAPFDLNDAIRRWRQNLAVSPAFSAENLDELEAHLRDSVSALVAKGLSEDEAWWVARRRTGSGDALSQEYGLVNAANLWLERSIWMVTGFIVIGWLGNAAITLSNLATLTAVALEVSNPFRGMLRMTAYPAALLAMLVVAHRIALGRSDVVRRAARWGRKHPIGLGLSAVVVAVLTFFALQGSILMLANTMPRPALGAFLQWHSYLGNTIVYGMWPVILACLLWRRSRYKEPAA